MVSSFYGCLNDFISKLPKIFVPSLLFGILYFHNENDLKAVQFISVLSTFSSKKTLLLYFLCSYKILYMLIFLGPIYIVIIHIYMHP